MQPEAPLALMEHRMAMKRVWIVAVQFVLYVPPVQMVLRMVTKKEWIAEEVVLMNARELIYLDTTSKPAGMAGRMGQMTEPPPKGAWVRQSQ